MKYKILSIYYYILYFITFKKKLKALYYATYIFIKNIKYNGKCADKGMCYCIRSGIEKVYNKNIDYSNIINYFPKFNNNNAVCLFNAKITLSVSYWWSLIDVENRYNYFKYLIKNERNNN